jgi:hypothetical protein
MRWKKPFLHCWCTVFSHHVAAVLLSCHSKFVTETLNLEPSRWVFLAASGARPALMIALLLLLFLLLFLLAFSSFSDLSLFVPCYGTFCAFPWHISLKSLFVPCDGTFCAFPCHISPKSHFVPCYGTFCALLWHISLKSLYVP